MPLIKLRLRLLRLDQSMMEQLVHLNKCVSTARHGPGGGTGQRGATGTRGALGQRGGAGASGQRGGIGQRRDTGAAVGEAMARTACS